MRCPDASRILDSTAAASKSDESLHDGSLHPSAQVSRSGAICTCSTANSPKSNSLSSSKRSHFAIFFSFRCGPLSKKQPFALFCLAVASSPSNDADLALTTRPCNSAFFVLLERLIPSGCVQGNNAHEPKVEDGRCADKRDMKKKNAKEEEE